MLLQKLDSAAQLCLKYCYYRTQAAYWTCRVVGGNSVFECPVFALKYTQNIEYSAIRLSIICYPLNVLHLSHLWKPVSVCITMSVFRWQNIIASSHRCTPNSTLK